MKVALIAGARPNFMKIAPLSKELDKHKINHFIVNTNQHFSREMAGVFFEEFNIKIDYTLDPPKDSIIKQFAGIMVGLEDTFIKEKPDVVIVVGDINSTLAGALVANKMSIKLIHVEAGLRSFNDLMPEEHNRVLTDKISDILFVTSEEGLDNLKEEGITENVYFVGNIMIDTLNLFLSNVEKTEEEFYFCTLHRAENVDDEKIFNDILSALEIIAKDNKIYFSLHPRTKKQARKFGLLEKISSIFQVLEPLSYKESLFYQKNAKLVLTDSGGIQEESSYLGTPCITLRTETERPVTITHGTNILGGISKSDILGAYKKCKLQNKKTSLPLWDGKVAERIVAILKKS